MRRAAVLIALIAILGSLIFGSAQMSAMADVSGHRTDDAYYTSIEIRDGDTLWSIACEYAGDLGLTTEEYIEDLRLMNHLDGDTIHEGRYLTVMYRGE